MRFEDDKLFILRRNRPIECPRPDLRNDLIIKAHSFGHFQVESTYNRLKELYFWKNMIRDIKFVVKQCNICQRNAKTIPKFHPAQATEVNFVFKTVSIDLVFGEDGYVGIAVIVQNTFMLNQ